MERSSSAIVVALLLALLSAAPAWAQGTPPPPPPAPRDQGSAPPAPPPPPGPAVPAAPDPSPPGALAHRFFTLSLFPPLSTNQGRGRQVSTSLSLSLFASALGELHGLDFGLGASIVYGRMLGVQHTLAFNQVGGPAIGAQLTLGANVVAGELRGLQTSAGANVVLGAAHGLQLTAGVNYTGGNVHGVQLAGGGNFALGRVYGGQVSGFNLARRVAGAQIGLINVGGDVAGTQIGLINIARTVKGLQLGLLNLARDASVALGLLSIIKKGYNHLQIWGSDTSLNLGVTVGSRYFYTMVAAGVQPSDCETRWLLGLGLGGHAPLPHRFFLNVDLSAWHVNSGAVWSHRLSLVNKLRIIAGYSVHRLFSVFAGATLNVLVSEGVDARDLGLIEGVRLVPERCRTRVRLWPGFVLGVQI